LANLEDDVIKLSPCVHYLNLGMVILPVIIGRFDQNRQCQIIMP
jgi:hypothetical protein